MNPCGPLHAVAAVFPSALDHPERVYPERASQRIVRCDLPSDGDNAQPNDSTVEAQDASGS